jgi:uncharacterized protein (TIGR03118 family)
MDATPFACRRLWPALRLMFGVAALLPAADAPAGVVFQQRNLVSDGFVPAEHIDDNLKNPWGMASNPAGGPFWIANQVSGTSTVYDGEGRPFPIGSPLVVTVPSDAGGGPTGTVFNGTNSFILSSGGKSGKGLFFFGDVDGSISGWNPTGDASQAVKVVTPSGPAVYTGLTAVTNTRGDFLLAANNKAGKIDVFDSNYQPASLAGNFSNPNVPAGLVPFNVQRIGQRLFVTYSISEDQAGDAPLGSGAVAEFDTEGRLVRHIASGGQLASPWGVTIAPTGFGDVGGALLIGNFNDAHGNINAFDDATGSFLSTLVDSNGQPIRNPYLWAINFGNGGDGGRTDTLYLVAGVGEEEHGVFASLSPSGATVIPLPSALLVAPAGLLLTLGASRRFRRRE